MDASLYRSYGSQHIDSTHLELQEEAIGKESILLLRDRASDIQTLQEELRRNEYVIGDLRNQVEQLGQYRSTAEQLRRDLNTAREAQRSAEAQAKVSRGNFEAALRERDDLARQLRSAAGAQDEAEKRHAADATELRRRLAEALDGQAARDAQVRQLQRDLDAATSHRRMLEQARADDQRLRDETVGKLTKQLDDQRRALEAALQRTTALETQCKDQEADATALARRIHDLEKRLSDTEQAAGNSQRENTQLQAELLRAQNALQDRDGMLARDREIRAALEEQTRELTRRVQNSAPASELESVRNDLTAQQRINADLRDRLSGLQLERERTADDNRKLAQLVDQKTRELDALQATLTAKARESESLAQRLTDSRSQIDTLTRDRDSAARRASDMSSDLQRSTKLLLETESRLRDAEQRYADSQREVSEAQSSREAAAQRRLQLARQRAAEEENLAAQVDTALSLTSPSASMRRSRPENIVPPSPLAVSRAVQDLPLPKLRDVVSDLDRSLGASGRVEPLTANDLSMSQSRLSQLRSY